jgi:hypothetical protein
MCQFVFRSQLNEKGGFFVTSKVRCVQAGQLTDVFCAVDNKLNVPGKIIPYEGSPLSDPQSLYFVSDRSWKLSSSLDMSLYPRTQYPSYHRAEVT